MSNELLRQLPSESKKQFDAFVDYVESGYKSVKEYYDNCDTSYALNTLYQYRSRFNWVQRREDYLNLKLYVDNFENQVRLSQNYNELLPVLVNSKNNLVRALYDECKNSRANIDSINKHLTAVERLVNLERRISNMDTLNIAVEHNVHEQEHHKYDINDALAYINNLEDVFDADYEEKGE